MRLECGTAESVLVLMPDKHLGNLVVSLTAIKALRDFYSGKKLFLVVDSAYEEIAQTLDWVDTLIFFPRKRINNDRFMKRASVLYDFCRKVRRASADISIDLDGRQASALTALLSGAKIRAGRASADMPYFYNVKVRVSEGRHKVHTYLDIASALGAKTENIDFQLNIPVTKRQSVTGKLQQAGLQANKPFVCIHPGAGKIYKQWTAEGFARISDWLTAEGYQSVFIGVSSDAKKIEEVFSELRRPAFNLVDKLSLGELMALFAQSSLYLGNDSGPMHLADRIGVPLVALFGPADEKRWGPVSKRSAVVRGETPCAKCKGKDCQYNFKCIRTLTPDEVKSAILRILSRRESCEQSA